MSFKKADRLPLIEVESYESETLKRWKREEKRADKKRCRY
jgi:hypothetical protein